MEKLIVLYEDNHLIVTVKPHNTPSQADESGDKDMLTMVKEYVKEKYNKEGEAFIGLVHRLDRPTGGIMVFARNSKSASRLSKQLADKEMTKTYYAVTSALPKQKSGVLTNNLKKDEKNNIVRIVPISEKGAKEAQLSYKVLATEGENALLEVKPKTGRGHQIRVQLAGINCPLYGDNKYGRDKTHSSSTLGLWAGRLEFTHPTTKQKMTFAFPPDSEREPWNKFYMGKYFLK
ncbi:MAG: RluA family pseudouridine synthase [Clostridia bacterium]|nr:RluA family pseudouridine synthase [Clostridia bacterium]